MTAPTKQPTDTLSRVTRVTRVIRGGGWILTVPSVLRSADRNGDTPAFRFIILGFRCAQTGCRQQVLKGE